MGGYSVIWLARALQPGGKLTTLEADQIHANVACSNFARAGLSGIVDGRIGRALDTLPRLFEEGCGPYDLVCINADKENTAE